jgi:hypothetical protein
MGWSVSPWLMVWQKGKLALGEFPKLLIPAAAGPHITSALFNNVPSPVRTLVAPEDLSSVRGDFGRFRSILGDFSARPLPKHTQPPGSWVGTEHHLKSALVPFPV